MRRIALLVVGMVGCHHARPARIAVAPAPAGSAPVAAPVSPWTAVPVRVMAWTPLGPQQIGALPGDEPKALPDAWYVEPIATLDEGALGRLVELLRTERVGGHFVPGLSLRGQPVAPWLGTLRDLPQLEALVLDDVAVDGKALAATSLSLARLCLERTPIDDAAIVALVAAQPALTVLDLEDTDAGDPAAAAIRQLAKLHAINLSGTRISDAGGAKAAAADGLQIVDFGRTRVAGKTVAALAKLHLRELFLDATEVGAEIAQLAPLAPDLERFDASDLAAHHPTDAQVGWLAQAPHLIEVGLGKARVHDPLVLALVAQPALRELRLGSTPITRAAVHAIAARADLEVVDLAETPADDESAAALLAAPHMRVLRLDTTPITDVAFAGPVSPALVELYATKTALTDAGFALLDQVPHLTALGAGDTRIGHLTLDRIAKLSELRTLVLTNVQAMPDAFAKLGALVQLERLYLAETTAGDETLTALAGAHGLRVLHLEGAQVDADALPVLRGFTHLEELTLGDTRLHAELIAAIADRTAWPRLRTLTLVGLDLGDPIVVALATRPQLTTLDLSATEISDVAALGALPRLRVLGLTHVHLSRAGQASAKALAARGVEIVR